MLEPILTHQMNFLHQEIIVASMIVDHEHGLCTQEESVVAVVTENFTQVQPTFRQMVPSLPEENTLFPSVDRVAFVIDAWMQLAWKTNSLQHQLKLICLKKKEQLKVMLDNINTVVVEGDTIWSSLHHLDSECNKLFDMVNDWVGLLECWNNLVEEFRAQIKQMN